MIQINSKYIIKITKSLILINNTKLLYYMIQINYKYNNQTNPIINIKNNYFIFLFKLVEFNFGLI